jgi:aminomethyltransferase
MVRTTPFHERLRALNETGLWSHWSGYLSAVKYQMAEKAEYFAIRNAAGIYDTSPLYKYRIRGRDAEWFLAGLLARDIRACRPGAAQYTIWCDDRGHVVEDGVVLRLSDDEFLLTAAEPNLAWFHKRVGRASVEIDDVSTEIASLAFQGPRSREILAALAPEVADLRYFHHTPAKIGGAAVTISRTGYTGDLGYELWVDAPDALVVWDALWDASRGRGVLPFGNAALLMTRIEAGLVLINVDFASSRFAYNDHERSTPLELGLGWMFRDIDRDDRPFVGRAAIQREIAEKSSRWRFVGLVVDWREFDERYRAGGIVPPKDSTPTTWETMLYGADGTRVGYATSFMYSPMLQTHIAMARVRPDLAAPGSRVNIEVTINHRYEQVGATVGRLPLFNPSRRTA